MEVINKYKLGRKLRDTDIYIGRPSPLSNPYPITDKEDRETVIRKYRKYIQEQIDKNNTNIIYPLRYLRNNYSLVCFCKPKPCHGDVIKEIWNKYYKDKPLVFVFGSNLAGIHGKGSAKYAKNNCGAINGVGTGYMNSCYAIPTKNKNLKTLPIEDIGFYVKQFKDNIENNMEYLITNIGCGLAGYKPEHIAPLFIDIHYRGKCILSKEFIDILEHNTDNMYNYIKTSCITGDKEICKNRIVISGSRSIDDYYYIKKIFKSKIVDNSKFDPDNTIIITGDAKGIDYNIYNIASMYGYRVFRLLANWGDIEIPYALIRNRNGYKYNVRGGMIRNIWMLVNGTHLLAIWDNKSIGTKHAIDYSKRLDLIIL